MAANFSELERQLRALSEEERARLALSLIESLEPAEADDIEMAWRAEIDARVEAYDKGMIKSIPGEEIFAEIRRYLDR